MRQEQSYKEKWKQNPLGMTCMFSGLMETEHLVSLGLTLVNPLAFLGAKLSCSKRAFILPMKTILGGVFPIPLTSALRLRPRQPRSSHGAGSCRGHVAQEGDSAPPPSAAPSPSTRSHFLCPPPASREGRRRMCRWGRLSSALVSISDSALGPTLYYCYYFNPSLPAFMII